MPEQFDPYQEWLQIPDGPRPPDYYTLLGIDRGVADPGAIERAAQERNKAVRPRCLKYPEEGTALLNEISAAKLCLLDPETRAEYDAALGRAGTPELDAPEPEEYAVQAVEIAGTLPAAQGSPLAARYCPHCARKLPRKAPLCVACAASAVGQAQHWLPQAGARCLACSAALTPGQVVCAKCQNDHALPARPSLPAGIPRHRPFLAHRVSLGGPVPTLSGLNLQIATQTAGADDDAAARARRPRHQEGRFRRAADGSAAARRGQNATQPAPVLLLAGASAALLLIIGVVVLAITRPRPNGGSAPHLASGATSPDSSVAATPKGTAITVPVRQGAADAQVDQALEAEISLAVAEVNEALAQLNLTPAQLLVLDERCGALVSKQPGHRDLQAAKAGCALLLWVEVSLADSARGKGTVPASQLDARLAEPAARALLPEESLPKLLARIRNAWFAELHEQGLARIRLLVAERKFAQALAVSAEEFPAPLSSREDEWRTSMRKAVEVHFVKDKEALFDQRRYLEVYNRLEEFRTLVEVVNPQHSQQIRELQHQVLQEAATRWSSPRWQDLPDAARQKQTLLDLMERLGPNELAKYDKIAPLLREARSGKK